MNLRALRRFHLRLTQAELARQLGVSLGQVRKWEENPRTMPVSAILTLVPIHLLGSERLKTIAGPRPLCPSWTVPSPRPLVAFCGPSDAGKTTMINALTGSRLKAAWSPTTAIPVFLKHASSRPRWSKAVVRVFRAPPPGQTGWNHRLHTDKGEHRRWAICSGNMATLTRLSNRRPEMAREGTFEPGCAVVYLRSDLLKVCDVVDLPGIDSGDREEDNRLARWGRNQADVLVFVSQANAFLRGEDLTFLTEALNQGVVTPERLLVVASQAHLIDGGDPQALKSILDAGCARLHQAISGTARQTDSFRDLRQRFTTYSLSWTDLRVDFEREFLRLLATVAPPIK